MFLATPHFSNLRFITKAATAQSLYDYMSWQEHICILPDLFPQVPFIRVTSTACLHATCIENADPCRHLTKTYSGVKYDDSKMYKRQIYVDVSNGTFPVQMISCLINHRGCHRNPQYMKNRS